MVAFPPQPGTLLAGQFRLDETLSAGTVGHTYRGTNIRTGQSVAVEVFSASSCTPSAFSRFADVATAVSELENPGTAKLLHASDPGEDPRFMVTEWLDGEHLGARIAREPGRRLPWTLAVEIASQCASILGEVQGSARTPHLDLKPTNCFLVASPDRQVKILEFGIIHLEPRTENSQGEQTQAISLDWENAYRAPEQILGEPLDERTDVYALGAILFELVAGHPPFTGSRLKVANDHLHQPPPSPREFVGDADIPDSVLAIINQALAKQATERFPDIKTLHRALDALVPRVPKPQRVSPLPERTEQWPRIPSPIKPPDQHPTEQAPRQAAKPRGDIAPTEQIPTPDFGPPIIPAIDASPPTKPPAEPATRPSHLPTPPVSGDPTIAHPKPRPPIPGRAQYWQQHRSVIYYVAAVLFLVLVIAYKTQCALTP